jgi:hypothetical protein
MAIKELRNAIAGLGDNADFVVSSDEELNTIFGKWEIAEVGGGDNTTYCIYGFSGSEIQLKEEE